MENPRAEKVAVVDEVRARLSESTASLITEYRGLTVAELASLRSALAAVGGDYKIFKNTLVRLAIADSDHAALADLLVGPTAITFVKGDLSAVAKALRDFAQTNPNLIIKGGLIEGSSVSSSDLSALADLPPREVLLARFAGALAAPMTQLASLFQAVPRSFAYGLSALLEKRVAEEGVTLPVAEAVVGAPAVADDVEDEAPAVADDAPEGEVTAEAEVTAAAAVTDEAPVTDMASEAPAPEAETPTEEAPVAEAVADDAPVADATEEAPAEAADGDSAE